MKPISLLPLACLVMAAPAYSQAPAVHETGVMLRASDLLPAEILRGPSYRVRDQVPTDGFLAHFEIDSDFGTFRATGVPQAKRRIVEIEAIRTLVNTSKSDLFAEGMKRSIEQPIDAVKNIVQNPVDSVKQAPRTVGHFFGKLGRSIGRGAEKVAEASQRPDGQDTGQAAMEAGRGIGNAAKNAAGFDKAKLQTAQKLGVDPYSDNRMLQEQMDKVTWAFFAGGMPLRVATTAASAGVAMAATQMIGIPEDTYALTESEINLRDEDALAAIGVTREDIAAFQQSRALSTTRRHLIVTSLGALPHAKGRGLIVRLANSCQTPEQADILISALAILVERQTSGSADYVALQVLGRLPGATTATGEMHVPAPVDHVTWTEEVAGFAARDDLGGAPKALIHTGRLSPQASAGILAAGWKTIAVAYPAKR